MDLVEELVALEAIKKVKHQSTARSGNSSRIRPRGERPEHGDVRHNRPAIGATAGIEQQEA